MMSFLPYNYAHSYEVTGKELASTCSVCHGENGNSQGPAIPTIAEVSAEYFIDSMNNFKDDNGRYSTIMSRIAKAYNDKEIQLMADYFSQQKMLRSEQAFNPKFARRGKKLHRKYCEKCHEDGGRSSFDEAGMLAGQWMSYLQYTLDDISHSRRDIPKKMKKKIQKLNKIEGSKGITQLLHYYSSQSDKRQNNLGNKHD